MSEFRRALALSGVLLAAGLGGLAVGQRSYSNLENSTIQACATKYIGPDARKAEVVLCRDNLASEFNSGELEIIGGIVGIVAGGAFAIKAAAADRKPRGEVE